MKYVCTLCGYVYDDEVEEIRDGGFGSTGR